MLKSINLFVLDFKNIMLDSIIQVISIEYCLNYSS